MEPDYRFQNRQQNFQPAPAPLPTPVKTGKKGCPIIVTIISLILAIGGVGFGIFEMMTAKSIVQTPMENDQNCPTCDITTEDTTDEDIRSLIDDFAIKLNEKTSVGFVTTYNTLAPAIYLEDAGVATTIPKSYGLYYSSSTTEKVKEVENAMHSLFTEEEYEEYNHTNTLGGSSEYIYKDKTIICQVYKGGITETEMSCAHTSWMTDEQINFIEELSTAYNSVNENKISYISANQDNIKTNEKNGYQYLAGGTLGAALIFYRQDAKSEWKFAYGGQNTPRCDIFTEEIKEALSGAEYGICYNEETEQEEQF